MPKEKEAAKLKSAAKAKPAAPANVVPAHGAADLPSVHVDSYNLELQDQEGFIGDRASNRAFRADPRRMAPAPGRDRQGSRSADTPTDEMSKKKIDKLLESDDVEAARRDP